MQTSRKQSYSSLLQRPHSAYLFSKIPTTIKKKCSCTQTDDFGGRCFCNFSNFSSLDDEFQENYTNSVRFINNCHDFMNKLLIANYKECGDSEPDNSNLFKIPKIPNYLTVLLLFLSKSNQNHLDINTILRNCNATLVQNKNVEVQIEDKKEQSECEVIFDKKVQEESEITMISESDFPKNFGISLASIQTNKASKSIPKMSDNLSTTNSNSKIDIQNVQVEKSETQKENYTEKMDNKELTNLIQEQVRKEVLSLINTENNLELVDTTCQSDNKSLEQESFSSENALVQEFSEVNKLTLKNVGELKQSKSESQPTEESNSEETTIKIADISPEKLDLMAYSLKKLRKKEDSSSKHGLKHRMTFSECKFAQQKSSKEILVRDCEEPSNLEVLKVEDTVKIGSSNNIQKVNELFQKISRESLKAREDDDRTTKRDYVSNRHTNYNNESYNNSCNDQKIIYSSELIQDDSDTDSVILDDEEYERKMTYITRQNVNGPPQSLWRTESFNSQNSGGAGGTQLKYHPLQLSEKDLSHVDDKMLKKIGIFTTNGFIKPEVIDAIEEKAKMRQIKSQKNKQFRTKRKIDFEVRYQPNSLEHCDLGVESSVSEDSFSLKSAVSYSSVGSAGIPAKWENS